MYVTRAIGKYEPFILNQPDNFRPDPKQVITVKLYSKPQTQSEKRQIEQKLTGE